MFDESKQRFPVRLNAIVLAPAQIDTSLELHAPTLSRISVGR
jgi:hypothetical protein